METMEFMYTVTVHNQTERSFLEALF